MTPGGQASPPLTSKGRTAPIHGHLALHPVIAVLSCRPLPRRPNWLATVFPMLCRDFPTEELYGSQSAPLELAEARSRHTTLPLFHSASSTGVVQPGSSSRSAAEDGDTGNAATLSSQDVRDTVINAGGPVWALGWCPTEVSLPAAARPELLNCSTTEGSGHSRPGSSSLAAAHYLAVRRTWAHRAGVPRRHP